MKLSHHTKLHVGMEISGQTLQEWRSQARGHLANFNLIGWAKVTPYNP